MKKYQTNFGFILIAFSISQIAVQITQKITGGNFIEPFLFLGVYIVSRDLRFKRAIVHVLNSNIFLLSTLFLFIFLFIGVLTKCGKLI